MPRSISKTPAAAGTLVPVEMARAGENRTFVALDFETADHGRDSACSVALVKVEGERIVNRLSRLIRPPRRYFAFTHIHGLTWAHVKDSPTFGEIWPEIEVFVKGAEFLAAHNAPFDRSVLEACCQATGVASPGLPFICTMRLARRTWGLRPTKLPDVCAYLGIPLRHHDAESDAEACARIMLRALKDGAAI